MDGYQHAAIRLRRTADPAKKVNMTNHQVWVLVAWGLYLGTILRGAYRASGINHTLMLNVTAASHILILFLIGTALVDSTGQFPDYFSALLVGIAGFVAFGGGLFLLRRKFEWNETLAAMQLRANLSAGLAAQQSTPARHRTIGEDPHVESAPTSLPMATDNTS